MNVHETVPKVVIEMLSLEPRGRLLDSPAGSGELSEKLKSIGFDVYALDLYPEGFQAKEIDCQRVDLNQNLPYKDQTFNYVVCTEGIEHMENSHHLIREFSRVLKDYGKIILSTPNILNIRSRISFLLRGRYGGFAHILKKPKDFRETLFLHINPIGFPELDFIMRKNNFKIEEARTSVIKTATNMFFLIYWLLRVLTKLDLWFNADKNKERLYKYLMSDELLLGETLVIKAVKTSVTLYDRN